MTLIGIIWILVQVLIGYNLVLPVCIYVLSFFKNSNTPVEASVEGDYGIIVTAYEQVTNIPAVVESLLRLNHSNYIVYIVADKCDVSSLIFNDDRVVVLRPENTLASNTRSHFYAINNFRRPHDRLTIIDSDNLVHPEYLNELDRYFYKGYIAVQGIREAKNLNTTYACLDAARDIYYHFYDGKLLFKVGSSATLAGSGMAFTTALYRDCLEHLDIIGAGFDKVLQSQIVGRDVRIAFTDRAKVYDEKTTHSDQLVNQRSRWINTWFKYFKFGFTMLGKGITTPSWNQFLFGLILLRPPLFIFLLLSLVFMFINIFISITAAFIWMLAFAIFIAGFYLALARSETDARIYRSLINIPKFIFFQVISLINARTANKRSVATKHTYTSSVDPITKSDES
ncbi:glycosyltransferase [Mucilaginibacter auburnensis]|uniref:Cellulose synthase/poly-beta-1,6-N-acetylglucosamine synthase-like glycosyltransferase n=1 Tax=Mucilaginibacter auburnensis TaxID=1457233 RepID=A0A2H9VL52_9SPHI|nr:glycosyltransferase [Mucilaginibacter auburnensis]PJJ79070.1 cellulose synthase/poly-beta-1,6-N-acetylglucosamine synthase-like glycosyltransferase [Mucilaginibacter auburnensis]